MSNAIPEDLKGMYADALMDSSKPWFWAQILPSRIVALIERIAAAEAERNRLRVDLYELRDVVTAENFAEMQQRAEKAEAELATARQTIQRLSAPVSDAENKYLFDLHDVLSEQDREPAPDIRKAVNALIAARKDANDKEKA
jgi:chromosome segregation ATPase